MILYYLTPIWRTAIGPLTLLAAFALPGVALGAGEGLAERMAHLQRHAHKLQLSIAARNAPLASFYLHEIEETTEGIRDEIGTYDDHPVGRLAGDMLLPAVEAVEAPVEAGEWDAADSAFEKLLGACNACHGVTDHGYIRIAPADTNPFNQDFSPAQ